MIRIRLAAARVNKQLTQKELAAIMNVSNCTINNWEAGKTGPNYDQLIKLSQLLEIPLDVLTVP